MLCLFVCLASFLLTAAGACIGLDQDASIGVKSQIRITAEGIDSACKSHMGPVWPYKWSSRALYAYLSASFGYADSCDMYGWTSRFNMSSLVMVKVIMVNCQEIREVRT